MLPVKARSADPEFIEAMLTDKYISLVQVNKTKPMLQFFKGFINMCIGHDQLDDLTAYDIIEEHV